MVTPATQFEIEIPEGVNMKIDGNTVEATGPKGTVKQVFDQPNVAISHEDQKIVVQTASSKRKQRAMVGTVRAHLRNMIQAVTEGFTYKLKVVSAHFPMTVKVEDKRVLINNFIGERQPRVANIVGDVQVNVKGDEITVEGNNKGDVGQTATNIEQATLVKGRDNRVFQDGCYIVERE